jgi:RsmE family RNA methyltransferase
MTFIYTPNSLKEASKQHLNQLHNQSYFISSDESEHLLSLRPQIGERFILTDLKGNKYVTEIVFVHKKSQQVEVKVLDTQYIPVKSDKKILFQAQIDKNYLEKWAEILPFAGFTDVYIFSSKYSIKQNVNLPRLEKILIRSLEQSQAVHKINLYNLNEESFWQCLKNKKINDSVLENEVFICPQNLEKYFIEKKIPSKNQPNNISQSSLVNSCIIGPEGGWSVEEIEQFINLNISINSQEGLIYPAWLAPMLNNFT